jgi:alkanesulfonate monooxygenase SsuD/methylene tetrahydromethanopterin reductase-like flavin-dependent oxidoreductase (luciferase family)
MLMDSLEREALERKKKLIALGCLPLSVGFFMWRLQGSTSAAPPPKAPPPPVTAQAAPAVAAAAGPVLSLEK